MSLKIYSDGGSRGNPGKSAFAVVVTRNGEILEEYTEFIGDDELIEVTPKSLRVRKSILDNNMRAKMENKKQ